MSDEYLNLLDDFDYKEIVEEMGEGLDDTTAAILEVEDRHGIPEVVGEIIDKTDLEEIAEEMKADQSAEVAMEEHKAKEEVLARQEREIEDLRQKLAEKERLEERAWIVWGMAFLILLCGTVITGALGIFFNNSFLIQTALYLFLFLLVALLFPEVVVRTPGISLKNAWQKLTDGSLKSSPPPSQQEADRAGD